MAYFHLDLGKRNDQNSNDNDNGVSSTRLESMLGEYATDELSIPMCVTCSTQVTHTEAISDDTNDDATFKCPVCLDPRQYIGVHGQKWTTLKTLLTPESHYHNKFEILIPGSLWTLKTEPAFGIGQRAFLIKDPKIRGLVMWDCIAYIDDATLAKIDIISGGQGISHMIVSHPHYYSTTATWTAAYANMTLWLAEADFASWYMRKDVLEAYQANSKDSKYSHISNRISLINNVQTKIATNLTILLLGGHFPGSLVLHWNDILLIADTIQVVPSGLYRSEERQRQGVVSVTFLWSYPNQIPLSAAEIVEVCKPLEEVSFNKAFGAFEGFNIWGHAKEKILQSRDIFCQRLSTQ